MDRGYSDGVLRPARVLAVALLLLLSAAPAQAAKNGMRVSVAETKREALVERGLLPLRVRADRAGVYRFRVALTGMGKRTAAVGRTVRFRRAGTRRISLRLTRPARRSLGRCRPATLRVAMQRVRSRRTARGTFTVPGCRTTTIRVDGATKDWTGTPTYVAGTSTLSRGELIHTDYLYDDYGANRDGSPSQPPFRANLAPVKGDLRYPADEARYGNNAADLRELRVAAAGNGLRMLIGLQTMKAPDAAIVTVAIDGDGDAATGAPWPEGTGLNPVGADRYVTTWGTGARFDGPGGSRSLTAAASLEENAIEVAVPASLLEGAGPKARIWIVTGLHAGDGRWDPRGVFNAGFRREEYPRAVGSAWSDEVQSAALAKGDVSAFAQPLPLSRLRARESDPPPLPAPGYQNRIFRSKNKLGEGIVLEANAGGNTQIGGGPNPTFLSEWQPYGLYIPKGHREGQKSQLLLAGHSLDHNLNQYEHVSPRFLEQVGDERNSIVITPLARGADTWYLDAGLVDVLEAWEDVRRHYAVDDERTSINGYSMGGYMTYRMGLLMPDRFARASVYVGPPAFSIWPHPAPPQAADPVWQVPGNTNQIVANAHNLPFEIVHGNLDELVPVSGVQRQADTFVEAGNPVRFYRHSGDDHFSFALNDEWGRTRDFLGDAKREVNPPRVVYRRMPVMDLPKHGLVFDGAYWVDGIELRDAAAPDAAGTVDATTRGLGGTRRTLENPPPQPVPGPTTPGTLTEQRVAAGEAIPRENGIELTLRNVRSLTLDPARMGIDPGAAVRFVYDTDGPATVRLGARAIALPTGKGELTAQP
jgi:dienelactone hydrolase